MVRFVIATEKQTENTTETLANAREDTTKNMTVPEAVKRHQLSYDPTSSSLVLQRCWEIQS